MVSVFYPSTLPVPHSCTGLLDETFRTSIAIGKCQIEDDLLYRWMKDASDYDADLPRGGATLSKLVAGEKEVKNEAGEVTRLAKEPTLHAKKSEMLFSPPKARDERHTIVPP